MAETKTSSLSSLPAWQALAGHAQSRAGVSLRSRLANAGRFGELSFHHEDLLVDFSKQRLDADTLALLLDLARARDVAGGIAALAGGAALNTTEGRAALHIALRADIDDGRYAIGGKNVMPEIAATLAQMAELVGRLHAGELPGATGKPIRHVINLGIGGSDLGPRMATQALADLRKDAFKVSFVASPDPSDLQQALAAAPASQTLFIVSSKSFSTAETLENARSARDWLTANLPAGADVGAHFIAVTNNTAAALAFGIRADRCLNIPDWVGGRFSLWSAIGLPIACALGMADFRALLDGARSMDNHFLSAPLESNLPVLLALVGLWNVDFLGISNLVVLPYRYALRHFPAHLQQLEMESNGKSVSQDGAPVGVATAPLVWGCAGPLGQHAFHQLFFQGAQPVALDFIVPAEGSDPARRLQITQALAQSAALALGKTEAEARAELLAGGCSEEEAARLAPHWMCPGNVPSTTIMMPGLSPYMLGQLVALYEHKVFVSGWLWGINSFDQFGVEYGKRMARNLAGGASPDCSTRGLWAHAQGLLGNNP